MVRNKGVAPDAFHARESIKQINEKLIENMRSTH